MCKAAIPVWNLGHSVSDSEICCCTGSATVSQGFTAIRCNACVESVKFVTVGERVMKMGCKPCAEYERWVRFLHCCPGLQHLGQQRSLAARSPAAPAVYALPCNHESGGIQQGMPMQQDLVTVKLPQIACVLSH